MQNDIRKCAVCVLFVFKSCFRITSWVGNKFQVFLVEKNKTKL